MGEWTVKKYINKHFARQLAAATVGVAMACLAISIFYLVSLGTDPYQVLCVAVHKRLGISHGMANNLLNGLIVLYMLLFRRKYVRPALFLCLFVSGAFVDTFNALLGPVLNAASPLWVRVCMIPIGCFLLGAGVFLYLTPDLGASPADGLGVMVAEAVKKPYSAVRIGMDALYTLAGFALGGPVGITTVCAVLLTGPCMGLCKRWFGESRLIRSLR